MSDNRTAEQYYTIYAPFELRLMLGNKKIAEIHSDGKDDDAVRNLEKVVELCNASQQTAILREENERLQQWKESMLEIWGPVIDWGQSKEAGLLPGTDITNDLLRRAKEYKQLQEEVERLRSVIEQIKKGVGQLSDEAKNILSPDGRFGQRAEDRNHGIESGAKLILTMISLIEDKALSSKESKPS